VSAVENPRTSDQGGAGLSRRAFATSTLGIALVGSVGSLFGGRDAAEAATQPGRGGLGPVGYGALVPDPAGLLALPAGFSYQLVAEAGVTRLESGELTPSDPDGTASFVRRGGAGSVLVNNHEISGSEPFPVPHLEGFVYDTDANGGTTNIEVDRDGQRVREYVSLAGTHNNCAGGVTPWDTWLTCEETEAVLSKRHGYVFEVDPYDQEANRDPRPIKAMGRYAHEAVAVDPREGTCYLTEDASGPNGLLYRYTPPSSALPLGKGSLRRLGDTDGDLDALVARDGSGAVVPDLSVATEIGTTYRVEWSAVADRDATTTATRSQFEEGQITRSRKLEGMWWDDGGTYVVSSFARESDGSALAHDGQVWFLDPVEQTIELKLRFAADPDVDSNPDGPDNITVSPFGGVMIAEDGSGAQHLVGTSVGGEAFFFARNELNGSEFTGPNFSYNRRMMFANIQSPGHVFSIQGPFRRQR